MTATKQASDNWIRFVSSIVLEMGSGSGQFSSVQLADCLWRLRHTSHNVHIIWVEHTFHIKRKNNS